jgi:acetyl esterase/lipase
MISPQAVQLWDAFRQAPKQIDLELGARRRAGEQAESPTREPEGVRVEAEPAVDGMWVTPSSGGNRATILYLFGGGYVLGSPASRRKTAGHLANAADARVLLANYRLAPESKFPRALFNVVAAYEFLLSRDVAPERTIVAGDSSGGGLALALLLALRGRDLPLPAGAFALSPWADLACEGASMSSRAHVDIMVTREGLLDMASQYLAEHDPKDPLASPVYGDFRGLSPLLLLVGGDEVLLDDAVRVAVAAGTSETDATLFVGAGMQHVWPTWVGALPEADDAIAMIGSWIAARVA